MPFYTHNFIYIGNFAQIDTDESDFDNENMSVLLGTYGPSDMEAVVVTSDDADASNSITGGDGGGPAEALSYTVGGVPTTTTHDAEGFYNGTITFGDGSTSTGTIIVFQASNGDTFVDVPAGASIQQIELTSAQAFQNVNGFNVGFGQGAPPTVVCYLEGTRIKTPAGNRSIETLKAGDLVTTADQGAQPLIWVSHRRVRSQGSMIPIQVSKGAFGRDMPQRDLFVSQQHRLLIASDLCQQITGENQVLIPAKKLLCLPGVSIAHEFDFVSYIHLLCERHEVVFAEGLPAETLLLGTEALKALTQRQLRELEKVLGGHPRQATLVNSKAVRPIPRGRVLKRLVRVMEDAYAPVV